MTDPNAGGVTEPVVASVDDPDEIAELASEIHEDDKGNKTVSLGTMLKYKREAKALGKKVHDLEPLAAQQESLRLRLDQAQPFIDALAGDPKLRAVAIARTRPSGEHTTQPADDTDATQWATDNDLWTQNAQGESVLDIARSRRQLDFMDQRNRRQTVETVRPYAELTVSQRADSNIDAALRETDPDGLPLATAESIHESADMLGAQGRHLLANPRVVELLVNNAIGLDRRKHRTPTASEEPLYLASTGGRGAREPAISAEEKAQALRLGLTEKDLTHAAAKLATGRAAAAGRK